MADSKKYDGSQWEHSLRKLTTATEAVENPLYSDGTAITAYTIKGNTMQDGTPTPSNPVPVVGVGELETTGEHSGEYKIPIVNAQGTSIIYLSKPIYKIGNYADMISVDGTVTRNIAVYEITGNESISKDTLMRGVAVYVSIPNISAQHTNTIIALSDRYIARDNAELYQNGGDGFSGSGGNNTIVVSDTRYNTVEAYINYFQTQYANGTPVKIYYKVTTPTTEQITLPSIPTTQGANGISVDTTVQPSEFTATWTGWHESSVKEWDGSDWQ